MSTPRKALAVVAAAVAAGAIVGGIVRLTAAGADPAARAAGAVVLVFAVAACAGAALVAGVTPTARLRRTGFAALTTVAASITASLVARQEAVGLAAAVVPAAALLLSAGAAWGLGACARRGTATVIGAALPLALAGAIFVADPWIEWRGAGPSSPARARWTLRTNPIAAICSVHGGTGVDWQSMKLLYDGPELGVGGLSVVGQYYPSRPPSPWAWSLAAAALGAALLLVPNRQRGW